VIFGNDIRKKIDISRMGLYTCTRRKSRNRRLFGWQLDQDSQSMRVMSSGPNGSLWSHHLQSWLVPDGATLRLRDYSGQMRLTYGEAEAQQKQAEARRADAEAQRADAAIQQAEALAEKLRSLGIDPDQIL
jgi:hypothetical protein